MNSYSLVRIVDQIHKIERRAVSFPFNFNLSGFNSPPLGAFNAFGTPPLLCGGAVYYQNELLKQGIRKE
jgi:hypothetical protein